MRNRPFRFEGGRGEFDPKGGEAVTVGRGCEPYGHRTQSDYPRLTYHIDNCARCGACPLKDVLNLRDTYGVQVAIATGGTIARRIVVQARPKLIVAVACERDLSSGIQDTHPLPVFGVINERPNGPCLDTFVSIRRLESAIRHFIGMK